MKTNYWAALEPGGIYHIYNRCVDGALLFYSPDNYHFFLRQWKKYILPYSETMAYCLMPNHFHFLVRIKDINVELTAEEGTVAGRDFTNGIIAGHQFIEDQFKRFFSGYSLALNKQQSRRGNLFSKRFKRIIIRSEPQLFRSICYIHHNPIHHKLAKSFHEWPFSSFNAYFSGKPSLVNIEVALEQLNMPDINLAKQQLLRFHLDFRKPGNR